jgi:hypothetical protein
MKMKTTMALIASIGLSSGATILNIADVYTGATPAADAPWVTITATTVDTRADGHWADVINLNVVASPTITQTEFISNLALTLDDSVDASNTNLQVEAIYGWWNGPASVSVNPDGVSVGGGDTLDLSVEFITANINDGGFRFKDNKSFDLTVTYTGPEALTDENVFGDDPVAVVHIQGIADGDSGWASSTPPSIPEPDVTMLLGGVALLGLLRRRK